MTEIRRLLNTTAAGQMAQKLDAKDGKVDGKIDGSIWNDFVKGKGGKEVQNSISVENAMKSITTYLVRNAQQTGVGINALVKDWSNKAGLSEENVKVGNTTPTAPKESVKPTPQSPAKPSGITENRQKAVEEDYNSVKFTVPDKLDLRDTQEKDAKEQANILKKLLINADKTDFNDEGIKKAKDYLENNINARNIAYIVQEFPEIVKYIDNVNTFFGNGFDMNDAKTWIWDRLVQRAKEHSLSTDQYEFPNDVRKLADDILWADSVAIEKHNSLVKVAQPTFDGANKLLAEVANMTTPPEIYAGKTKAGVNYKNCVLPDGRWIQVNYDKNGEISKIMINTDTNRSSHADVKYTSEEAWFNSDNKEGTDHYIQDGYDFNALKALVEKIFGKGPVE